MNKQFMTYDEFYFIRRIEGETKLDWIEIWHHKKNPHLILIVKNDITGTYTYFYEDGMLINNKYRMI